MPSRVAPGWCRPRVETVSGFTLVEIIVNLTLLFLVLSLAYALFSNLLGLGRNYASRVDVQQQANLAHIRLAQDLDGTASEGIGVAADQKVLAITPILGLSGEGRREWAPHAFVYYLEPTGGRLVRRVWSRAALGLDATENAPPTWDETLLRRVTSEPAFQEQQTIAANVQSFEAKATQEGTVEVRLVFEKPSPNRTVRLTTERVYPLVNGIL